MPRGGARPGAGRKPKSSDAARGASGGNVVPFASAPSTSTPPSEPAATELIDPPTGLTEKQAVVWRALAPAAVEQRTLVPATVHGFTELCELKVFKDGMAAQIEQWGVTGKTGRERLKSYTQLAQRVDAALARFKLTAFGKPADGGKKQAAATNPWAAVVGGAR